MRRACSLGCLQECASLHERISLKPCRPSKLGTRIEREKSAAGEFWLNIRACVSPGAAAGPKQAIRGKTSVESLPVREQFSRRMASLPEYQATHL